ncbi:hypothetical protein EJA01_09565 [Rhodovulum iodosum]|uniref:hypothetical protein n=1 Tax=Rhodovulum iodosum TaxID=68291 RepID=UPI000F68C5FC|nr:hypothetical protein [Rhodovulum robiginosum]RSK33530.1 hypothetical protein EJA01_09565 [Rhodovulum robiginosum]
MLEEAEAHYRRTIHALDAIIGEIEAGHSQRAKALKGALSDLGKAAQTAFDERERVEKRLRTETGGECGYALDLAEARAEIGRRLDRLRAAQAARGVPE